MIAEPQDSVNGKNYKVFLSRKYFKWIDKMSDKRFEWIILKTPRTNFQN